MTYSIESPIQSYVFLFLFDPFSFDLLKFPQQLGRLVLFIVTVWILGLANGFDPGI